MRMNVTPGGRGIYLMRPIDDDMLAYQLLAQLGERMARMEARAERADAHAEAAEKERTRQGKEIAELRADTKSGFEELRNGLRAIVTMASAGKLVLAVFVIYPRARGARSAVRPGRDVLDQQVTTSF